MMKCFSPHINLRRKALSHDITNSLVGTFFVLRVGERKTKNGQQKTKKLCAFA